MIDLWRGQNPTMAWTRTSRVEAAKVGSWRYKTNQTHEEGGGILWVATFYSPSHISHPLVQPLTPAHLYWTHVQSKNIFNEVSGKLNINKDLTRPKLIFWMLLITFQRDLAQSASEAVYCGVVNPSEKSEVCINAHISLQIWQPPTNPHQHQHRSLQKCAYLHCSFGTHPKPSSTTRHPLHLTLTAMVMHGTTYHRFKDV